jgi:hypothetical protein
LSLRFQIWCRWMYILSSQCLRTNILEQSRVIDAIFSYGY